MQYLVSKDEQERIKKAIEEFERKSSAEILTVIAKQSDTYLYIPTLFAALSALLLPWIFFGVFDGFSNEYLGITQLVVFMILALLAQIKPIKMLLVPNYIKRKRASNLAKMKFFEFLEQEQNRDGLVMLFVSEAEKYVEILTDSTIAQKVDNSLWDEAVQNFIVNVKNQEIAKGYLQTIEKASKLLIELFPSTKDDKDSMPNHLILI